MRADMHIPCFLENKSRESKQNEHHAAAITPVMENAASGNPVQQFVLNKIPLIFRTCEVYALFPGQPCDCVSPGLASVEDFGRAISAPTELPDCMNYVDLVSWWGRLWPRQEFMYAGKISIKWTGTRGLDGAPRCISIAKAAVATSLTKQQFGKLTKPCRMHLQDFFWLQARSRGWTKCRSGICWTILCQHPWMALEVMFLSLARKSAKAADANTLGSVNGQGGTHVVCSCAIALDRLKLYQNMHYETMKFSLMEKMAGQEGGGHGLRQFLGGNPIETEAWGMGPGRTAVPQLESEEEKLQRLNRFTKHLGLLGRSSRLATKARDLVGAVWPDCPECTYKDEPDADYRELLKVSIGQVQKRFKRAFITTAPIGLFGRTSSDSQAFPSWYWRPSGYLERETSDAGFSVPKSTAYVYGTMSAPFLPVQVHKDPGTKRFLYLQLRERGKLRPPLSRGARLFEERFTASSSREEVRDFLARAVTQWPRYVLKRCVGPEALVLGTMLGGKNEFIMQTVLPVLAKEQGWKTALYGGLALRWLLMSEDLSNSLAVMLAGEEKRDQVHELLRGVRDGSRQAEEIYAHLYGIQPGHAQMHMFDKVRKFLMEKKARKIKEMSDNKVYQTMRDQAFFDEIVNNSDRGASMPRRPTASTQAVSLEETAFQQMISQDGNPPMHIDIAYYLVAEALGFSPKDIGVDYDLSWQPSEYRGRAHVSSKLRLMISDTEPPMLGFTHLDPKELGRRPDGDVMTVAYLNEGRPEDGKGNPYGNCCYEVQRCSPDDAMSWSIVGVWVPVARLPANCSAWFGEGAGMDAKLY